MAGTVYSIRTGPQALSAAVPQTAIQVGPVSPQGVKCLGFSVAFNGVNPTAEPVLVKLVTQGTAGTMTTATAAIFSGGTKQSTTTINSTVNPSASAAFFETLVHPQGSLHIMFPPDMTPIFTTRFGLEITAPAAVTAHTTMFLEE